MHNDIDMARLWTNLGFEKGSIGSGMSAYRLDVEDCRAAYIVVTNDNWDLPDDDTDLFTVRAFDSDGWEINIRPNLSLIDAIKAVYEFSETDRPNMERIQLILSKARRTEK